MIELLLVLNKFGLVKLEDLLIPIK